MFGIDNSEATVKKLEKAGGKDRQMVSHRKLELNVMPRKVALKQQACVS